MNKATGLKWVLLWDKNLVYGTYPGVFAIASNEKSASRR